MKPFFIFFFTDFIDVTKKLEGGLTDEIKVKEPVNQQIHRMCLLRVKLMHFVNSLHNYIMTRVRGIDLFTAHMHNTRTLTLNQLKGV